MLSLHFENKWLFRKMSYFIATKRTVFSTLTLPSIPDVCKNTINTLSHSVVRNDGGLKDLFKTKGLLIKEIKEGSENEHKREG